MVGSNLVWHEGESNTPAFLFVSGLSLAVAVALATLAFLVMRKSPRKSSAQPRGLPWWFAVLVIGFTAGVVAATWLFMRLTGIWYAIT
jgi:hypothetical protein